MSTLAKTISKNLRRIRLSKGLSQRELAEETGFDEKFISQLENKPRHISTKTLERLADGLGVNNSELLMPEGKDVNIYDDTLSIKLAPGIDEAIKTLKMLRTRVKS